MPCEHLGELVGGGAVCGFEGSDVAEGGVHGFAAEGALDVSFGCGSSDGVYGCSVTQQMGCEMSDSRGGVKFPDDFAGSGVAEAPLFWAEEDRAFLPVGAGFEHGFSP